MTDELMTKWLATGLLQPGVFEDHRASWRLQLNLLPSYPEIMGQTAKLISIKVAALKPDYLVCTPDCLPVATLVSYIAMTPLVYSRGRDEAPVHDLAGAYDTGHPSVLLTYQLSDDHTKRILDSAHTVGLDLMHVIAITGIPDPDASVPEYCLIREDTIENVLLTRLPRSS